MQRGLGTANQVGRRLTRGVKAHQRDKACLPAISILAGRLAKGGFITIVIEKIVGNLKGQPKVTGIIRQRCFQTFITATMDAAGDGREPDQRAGMLCRRAKRRFRI